MKYPEEVVLVEVGPRDGLQNEPGNPTLEFRIELINKLSACGFKYIEVGSFVSPKWVPQMANTDLVFKQINHLPSTVYVALVPNEIGMSAAIAAGIPEIAVFAAASETFSRRNINKGIDQSLKEFEPIAATAMQNSISVRGYVSCVCGCPYEGEVEIKKVVEVVEKLLALGCREVSLGDTIGVGTPLKVQKLLATLKQSVPTDKLAVHFHDTFGQALSNILVSLDEGISTVDSSIGGLGGCPYANGASGNVATEEVIYMLDGLGVHTGIHLDDLVQVSQFVSAELGCPTGSKVSQALLAKKTLNPVT